MLAESTPLDLALERASRYFLSRQDSSGYWVGELESNATITAEYVFFRRLLGYPVAEPDRAAARHLLGTQADGGWAAYFGGPPDLSTTVEAAVALRLCGVPADASTVLDAATVIRALGGIGHTRVFTRIWLRFLGALPDGAVPIMPAEMMLLPRAFPLSIYRFSSWARGTIVPLLILLNLPLRYSGDVPDLSDYWVGAPAFVPRKPCRTAASRWFHGLDRHGRRVAPILGRLPARPTALEACRRWLLAHQERDGGWGGIQPAMVHSALALAAYGRDWDAVAGAVAAIESFCIHDDGRLRMQSCVSPGWDTPWTMLALREAGLPADHTAITSAARWLLAQQTTRRGDWALTAPSTPAGGWSFEYANTNYPDTDDTAIVLQALAATAVPSRAARAAGLMWLLGMQNADGGWGAFDRDNDTALVQAIPFCDFGEVLDPSSADVTAHILELLAVLGCDRREAHVRRGLQYLLGCQERDGSWFGRWGVNYIYGTSASLQALAALGFGPSDAPVAGAVAWLRRHQNDDGGWGESCRSYEDAEWRGRGSSTASQTAWAILGLLPFVAAGDGAVEAAVHWLLDRQSEDGTWPEPWFTGTGFPGDFYIKYHEYRNYFPLLALARARGRAGVLGRHQSEGRVATP